MATVVYLVLDRRPGSLLQLRGTPAAARAHADGPHFLEGGAPCRLERPTPRSSVRRRRDPAGSSLLLYTDGLVERRDVGWRSASDS